MHKKVTIPMYKILRFALGSEYKKLVARVTMEYANVAVSGANQHVLQVAFKVSALATLRANIGLRYC